MTNQDETALVGYAGRDDVRELSERLLAMLPSVKEVGKVGALALAQTAIALGLNPLVGELWAIPSKDKDGNQTFSLMAGIKGLRRAARNQAERDDGFYTVFFRVPRGDEVDGMAINPGDIVRCCDCTVSGNRAQRYLEQTGRIPVFTGIGIYRAGEKTRMQPLHVARKRAEADALKQAFDLPLAFAGDAAPEPDTPEPDVVDAEITECKEQT